MNLTKPAGVFLQLIGVIFLIIAFSQLGYDPIHTYKLIIYGVIGGLCMYIGGRPARR